VKITYSTKHLILISASAEKASLGMLQQDILHIYILILLLKALKIYSAILTMTNNKIWLNYKMLNYLSYNRPTGQVSSWQHHKCRYLA